MNKKHTISVYHANPKLLPDEKPAFKITRVLWAEQIGNFNPIFCRYKGKRTLVQSREGDLSDPFRREESYLKELYIVVGG